MAKKFKLKPVHVIIVVLIIVLYILNQTGREATVPCTSDSDGNDYYNKGFVTLPDGQEVIDFCYSPNHVMEQKCVNGLREAEIYACQGTSCNDGACVSIGGNGGDGTGECSTDTECPETQYCWFDASPNICRDKIATGSTQICQRNRQCESGYCNEYSGLVNPMCTEPDDEEPTCTDLCQNLGDKSCVGNAVAYCNYYDDELCLKWGALSDICGSLTCESGECISTNECNKFGDVTCPDDNTHQTCIEQNGVLVWSSPVLCGTGNHCVEGGIGTNPPGGCTRDSCTTSSDCIDDNPCTTDVCTFSNICMNVIKENGVACTLNNVEGVCQNSECVDSDGNGGTTTCAKESEYILKRSDLSLTELISLKIEDVFRGLFGGSTELDYPDHCCTDLNAVELTPKHTKWDVFKASVESSINPLTIWDNWDILTEEDNIKGIYVCEEPSFCSKLPDIAGDATFNCIIWAFIAMFALMMLMSLFPSRN